MKENLSIIVLLPALLGGIWQLLELAFIGIAYIRFFSVSQIVSDGLLILFLLIAIVLFFKLLSVKDDDTGKIEEGESTTEHNNKAGRKIGRIVASTILLVSGGILLSLFYAEIKPVFIKHKITFPGLMMIVAGCTMIFHVLTAAIRGIFYLKDHTQLIKYKWIFQLGVIVGAAALLFGTAFTIRVFHNSFLLPEDLKNTENVVTKIRKDNSKMKTTELLYFNDKYLFVRVFDSTNNSYIQVVDFNAMISDDLK